MRILQLIYEAPGSPFGFGGAGVRAHEIYKRLVARHETTLLSMRYPGARDREEGALHQRYLGSETGSLSQSVLSYTIKAAQYVKGHGGEFDVIVENFLPSTPFFARFLTKTPVVLQVQGILERHALRKFRFFHALPMFLVERFYPGLYHRFIFVSDVTRSKVLSRIRREPAFSPVIPNGIDPPLLETPGGEENYILFLSRIDIYTKGLDLLVDAFRTIAGFVPEVKLVLAGYEFDRFGTLVAGLPPPLRERISYAGFATGEVKARLLSRAKFFVLPSRHESAPISVLEAAACGKAVLVSDIPELKFAVDSGFGTSFASGSVNDLSGKMMALLQDASMRDRLGYKGRQFAKNFLWDRIAGEFEQALQSVALSTGSGVP